MEQNPQNPPPQAPIEQPEDPCKFQIVTRKWMKFVSIANLDQFKDNEKYIALGGGELQNSW